MITARRGFFLCCALDVFWSAGAKRAQADLDISIDSADEAFDLTINAQVAKTQIGDVIDGRYIVKQELQFLPTGYGAPISSQPEASFLEANGTKDIDGWTTSEELGAGAYGRAYLVADKHNPGRDLVLKELLDCQNEWNRRATYRECKMMQDMHQEQYVAQDKVGASRILNCLELHIDYNLPLAPTSGGLNAVLNGRNPRNQRPKPRYACPNRQYIIVEFAGRPLRQEELKYEVAILKQMLQGVRYMANLGYSHRDLKPDNVLVQYLQDSNSEWTPIVKIIDFGLATKDWTCKGGRTGDCNVDFSGYHWSPPEVQKGTTFMLTRFPYMPPDAYDVWSVGLIMVDQVCPESAIDDPVLLQERKRQWALLTSGLSDDSDYDMFFCGTSGFVDAGTEKRYKGFWPTICGLSCEEFYQNKALMGLDTVIGSALMRDPQLRNRFQKQQTEEILKKNNVAQETVYVPEIVGNGKLLVQTGEDTFQVSDPSGQRRGVSYRRSKNMADRIDFAAGLHFGAKFTGVSDGEWVETKAYIPQLGSISLLPFLCHEETYMLEGGRLVPDKEDFEHQSEVCRT